MADIVYTYNNSVYMNITNRCPCACIFCVRKSDDGIGSAGSLWHRDDPTWEQIKSAIDAFDFSSYDTVTFCGFGEPTSALDNLIASCKYLKSKYNIAIRLNTNGLSDLNNGKPTAHLFEGLVDIVSISLNAPERERYYYISMPRFGMGAFDSLINFIKDCKKYIKTVKLTVVDILTEDEIEACRKIAEDLGTEFRVRKNLS